MPRYNKNGLTDNQQIFSDEYLKDRNGSRSYKVAYVHHGSDAAAEANASRLIRNDRVDAYITKQLEIISKESRIEAARLLKEEARIAFSDIGDMFDGDTLIPPSELPEDVRRAIASVEVIERTIPGTGDNDPETETRYKYKLWDKGQSLQRAERHLGMFSKDNEQSRELIIMHMDPRIKKGK